MKNLKLHYIVCILLLLPNYFTCFAKNNNLKVHDINIKRVSISDQIRISGSSTLYPFISLAGERYSTKYNLKPPIVESIGTGGGFNNLCSSDDTFRPHIVAASRPIKQSETELCHQNGVYNIKQIPIGYDAIVIAENIFNKGSMALKLTTHDIFLAISKYVPKNEILVANHYKFWDEINPSLPHRKILFYGPPSTSGTRDSFVELVFAPNCNENPVFKQVYQNDNERKKQCTRFRNDGVFIDVGENDNITIRKLGLSLDAVGILGYDYFVENKSIIRSIEINDQNIFTNEDFNTSYPLLRLLYLYTTEDVLSKSKPTKLFIDEMLSPKASQKNGYLNDANLIPL